MDPQVDPSASLDARGSLPWPNSAGAAAFLIKPPGIWLVEDSVPSEESRPPRLSKEEAAALRHGSNNGNAVVLRRIIESVHVDPRSSAVRGGAAAACVFNSLNKLPITA